MSHLDTFYKLFLKSSKIDEKKFPTYIEHMCKLALEDKFSREFPLQEVRDIIKDKSWQWRTSPQSLDYLKGELETHSASGQPA